MKRRILLPILLLAFLPALASAQASHPPLTRAEILGQLAAGSSPSYLAHLVKTRGINFTPDAYFLSLIHLAGGDGILLERISAARAASSFGADPPFYHLARCAEFLQTGNITEAESECREAAREDPANPWPLLAITRCVADPADRREDAIPLLRHAVELAPSLAEPHLALARALPSFEERKKELREAARLNPQQLDVIQQGIGGWLNVRPQDHRELMTILTIEPDSAAAHAAAASYYAMHGTREQFLAEMREAIRLEPQNASLHSDFARFYGSIADDDGELAELREAVRVAPQSIYRLKNLAFTLWVKDKAEDAIAAFREVLKLYPQDYISSFRLVELLLGKGEREEAIAELRRFLEATAGGDTESALEGERLFSRKYLGDLLFQKRDLQSAAAEFEIVLQQEPEDARTHYALGSVRFAQGLLKEAISEFKQALQWEPDFPAAENDLAWTYATSPDPRYRDPQAALKHAQHAVDLLQRGASASPEQYAACLDTLAEALFINGRLNEAVITQEQAVSFAPANAELKERLERFRKAKQPPPLR